jgi:hypothetical protein
MEGAFTAAPSFTVTSARVVVPVTFYAEQPPLPVPLERVTFTGTMSEEGLEAKLYGVVPGEDLRDQVIDPLVPPEGVDSDGDGDVDYTKEFILESVTTMLENEFLFDIELDGDRRGTSAAFRVRGVPSQFLR